PRSAHRVAGDSGHCRFFLDYEENTQCPSRRKNRSLQDQKRDLRASDLREQRAQFSRPRLHYCARPAATAVDRALREKMPVALAVPPRPFPASPGNVEVPAALDRQLRRCDSELQGIRSADEAAATDDDASD